MPSDDSTLVPLNVNSVRLGGWRWLIVYALLSMLIQWPIVGSLTTHISYGHEPVISVPLLNLWTVWWNADRAAHGFRGYWNAPIFYPTEKTLIFSEAQPSSVIVAPILGLTGNRGLAYNVYQLLILALNGYSAHRLFRRIGHVPWLAFCGGVMSQILPFVMWQSGVVQLTTLFGIHWTVHAVLDLFGTVRRPQRSVESENLSVGELGCGSNRIPDFDHVQPQSIESKPKNPGPNPAKLTLLNRFLGLFRCVGLQLGLAYGFTYWLCNYWGLFLTLLLVPSSLFLVNSRLFTRSFWINVSLGALVAAVMIGPFAWQQRSSSHEHDWHRARSQSLVHDLSAHWRDHTKVPWKPLVPCLQIPDADRANVWMLGGGGLKLLLVPLGLISSFTTGRRRWGLFAFSMGVIAFALSLGPTVCVAKAIPWCCGVCPYELLQRYVAGFSLIRSPFRFAVFVQLATVWLSIESLDLLNPLRWSCQCASSKLWTLPSIFTRSFDSDCVRDKWLFFPAWIPLVVISTVISLEAVPPTTTLYKLPSDQGLPFWVQWLRDPNHSDGAIACLPFPTSDTVNEFEETTLWMYWSTFHRHPLMNGYSGFFPDSFMATKQGLGQFQKADGATSDGELKHFRNYSWDNVGLKRLNESGILYVVMKRSFGTEADVRANPITQLGWALVATDETEKIDIYRLPAQPVHTRRTMGSE